MRVFGVIALLLLAGCAGAPIDEADSVDNVPVVGDPVAAGPLATTLFPWDLGLRTVQGSTGVYPVELYGEATMPDGEGPFPVAIFMHGRHGTCSYAPGAVGLEFLGAACPRAPPAMEPVDSYTGYRYLAEHLAAHGIAVVSVTANNVNDYDLAWGLATDDSGATARGRIILMVIDELKQAAAAGSNGPGGTGPDMGAFAPSLDMSRIGLMGHSRGGEGVIRAAVLNDQGPQHDIAAVFALAPTDFARWVMPDVAFGTILPYCDGDVSNLQGAWAYDDMPGAPKHQFLDMGANHNFYNTVWTGDDWRAGDSFCASGATDGGRYTMEEQQTQGIAIMGSFFRFYLGDDAALWPYLEGSLPFTTGAVHTSTFPQGAQTIQAVTTTGGVSCEGFACPIPETYSMARQWYTDFTDGNFVRDANMDLDAPRALTFRIGVAQGTSTEAIHQIVAFADADGLRQTWPLAEHGLFTPPGDGAAKTTLNQVWLPLNGTWDRVDRVGLIGPSGTQVQTTDWMFVA